MFSPYFLAFRTPSPQDLFLHLHKHSGIKKADLYPTTKHTPNWPWSFPIVSSATCSKPPDKPQKSIYHKVGCEASLKASSFFLLFAKAAHPVVRP